MEAAAYKPETGALPHIASVRPPPGATIVQDLNSHPACYLTRHGLNGGRAGPELG